MKLLASALLAALSLCLLSASLRFSRGAGHPDVLTPSAPLRSAPPVRTAPRPSAAPKAQDGWPTGNTDGGPIPWNGGDLYMRDYSGLTHPKDGAPR